MPRPFAKCKITSIEPINHALVVLLVTAEKTNKKGILLARIQPQSSPPSQDEARPSKRAKRDEESGAQNECGHGEFSNQWTYTILDYHKTDCSKHQCRHQLSARDTLDSIVHETCTKYEFYGVANEKLVFQHQIRRQNVVVQDDHEDEEYFGFGEQRFEVRLLDQIGNAKTILVAHTLHTKFLPILDPPAWTVIGDTFYALNTESPSEFLDEWDAYSVQCVDYIISAGKPLTHQYMDFETRIMVGNFASFLRLYLRLIFVDIFSLDMTAGLTAV